MDSGSVYEGMDKEQTYEEHREAFLNHIEIPGVPYHLAVKAFNYHEEVRAFYKRPVSSADEMRVGTALSKRLEEEKESRIRNRARLMGYVRQWVVAIAVLGLVADRVAARFF